MIEKSYPHTENTCLTIRLTKQALSHAEAGLGGMVEIRSNDDGELLFAASQRELEILLLKSRGLTYGEIGHRLGIKTQTAKNIIGSLKRRNKKDGNVPGLINVAMTANKLLLNDIMFVGIGEEMNKLRTESGSSDFF
jgi:hypothetical protein